MAHHGSSPGVLPPFGASCGDNAGGVVMPEASRPNRHVGALIRTAVAMLGAVRTREALMSSTEWAWSYGRDDAMHGARAKGGEYGSSICAALLETEAERRLNLMRESSSLSSEGGKSKDQVAELRDILGQIGREMLHICANIMELQVSVRADSTIRMDRDGDARDEEAAWCDLRHVKRRKSNEGAQAISAHVVKFELWGDLGHALAWHAAALSM